MNEKTEKKNAWIQLPEDVDKPLASISLNNKHIVFVEIAYDQDAKNPEEAFDCSSPQELQAWKNGEVFGYMIVAFSLKEHETGKAFDQISDYRFDTPILADSCWGFYGYDWFLSNLQETIENLSISE